VCVAVRVYDGCEAKALGLRVLPNSRYHEARTMSATSRKRQWVLAAGGLGSRLLCRIGGEESPTGDEWKTPLSA